MTHKTTSQFAASLFLTPLLIAPLLISPSHAQDEAPNNSTLNDENVPEVEIVVTPTRTERAISDSASPVTIITREQIQAKKSFDILDVLRQTPGLSIAQSGTFGKNASVFLRGAASNQTLVLLDGVRANSPADGRFDFGTVPIENVERIEILRGPQGALYGADAIGGVINIITRRGRGPLQTGGAIEYGSQNTNKQIVNVRGSLDKNNRTGLSFSASRLDTNGFFNNDDYRSLNASLRLDRELNSNSNLSLIGRIEDAQGGTPGQRFLSFDPNARSQPRLLNGTLQYTNSALNGTRVTRRDRVSLGLTHRRLGFNDPINVGDPFPNFTTSDLRDQVLVGDAQTTFERGPHAVTVGGELRRESARGDSNSTFGATNFDQSTSTRALWLQDEYKRGSLSLVPGVRYEDNSQYGGDLNGRLAAAYELRDGGRIKASVATGFRAPSINELYFPNYGNPNLNPEQSTGLEIGYSRPTTRQGNVEITAFTTRYRDLIGTAQVGNNFMAANINRARVSGLELSLRQPLNRNFTLNLNHAFLNTTSSTGELLRRPKFATTADLLYRKDRIGADLGLIAQGRRFDNDFAAPPFGNGQGAGFYSGFERLDFTISYDLQPELQLYVRAQNVLDKNYSEAAGFPAAKFNFVIGLQTRAF